MAKTLRLRVFGRFEAEWSNGEAIAFTARKARSLLTFLAVEHPRPQTREYLATLLWGDSNDERARHNLRQVLSKVRGISDQLILSEGDCISINTEVCNCDAVEFARLTKSEDPVDMRRCLDLYRGDLLAGVAPREREFDEWLVPARTRLRRTACSIANNLVTCLRAHDQPQEAIDILRVLLRIDPAYEPAHRNLMELLAETGHRADALRQYQECIEALARELGAEPDASTRALHESMKSGRQNTARTKDYASTASPPDQARELPTVAVLPFENLSGDPEDRYFVDGMTEDINTALSCFHSMVVIARGSSFLFRDRNMTDSSIANELGAQFLVRGSVQRASTRVRINVQLLDADAGLNVWAHRYDREMQDVFVLQDEITSTLVSTLAGRVEAVRLAQAQRAPVERLDAHDNLLRGKYHHHLFTAEDCARCINLFERAIEQDPTYAVAHAWLGCGLGQAMVFRLDDIPSLVGPLRSRLQKGAGAG